MARPGTSKNGQALFVGIIGREVYFDLLENSNQRAQYAAGDLFMTKHDGELPSEVTVTDVASHVYAVRQSPFCNKFYTAELVIAMCKQKVGKGHELTEEELKAIEEAYKAGIFDEREASP